MKFVKFIRESLKIPNGKRFADLLGVHPEYVYKWEKRKGLNSMRFDHLCKLRKLSKMSWSKFGKMLDEEFLKEED